MFKPKPLTASLVYKKLKEIAQLTGNKVRFDFEEFLTTKVISFDRVNNGKVISSKVFSYLVSLTKLATSLDH